MGTATAHNTPHGHAPHGNAHDEEPKPLDPEHDIDAKSSTIWVLGGTVVLFISLWVMLPIFTRVLDEERRKKVDELPNTELIEILDAQHKFLDGQNPTKKKLDQAMRAAVGK